MQGWSLFALLAGCAGAALMAGFAAGRYSQRRHERAARPIRHLLPPEEQDALLQGLQGLTLQIHAITEDLPAGDAARQRLREVLASADHLLAWGDGSVSGQEQASDSQRGLALAIAEIAREFNRQHPLSFHMMVQGARQRLTSQARELIEQISRESTARACRATHAQRMCVELLYLEAVLCIRIHDDGPDAPDRCADAGPCDAAGLCSARWQTLEAQVRALGGQMEVWARPSVGTELVVVIPAASAYEAAQAQGVRRHIARWFASRS